MPHPFVTATYADERARALRDAAADRRRAPRRSRRVVVPDTVPANLMQLPTMAPTVEACTAA